MIYTHITPVAAKKIVSPLDQIPKGNFEIKKIEKKQKIVLFKRIAVTFDIIHNKPFSLKLIKLAD